MTGESHPVSAPSQPSTPQPTAGTMALANSGDPAGQLNAPATMTINTGPLTVVSQTSAVAVPGSSSVVNTSSGTPVHIAVPSHPAPAPTPAPAAIPHSSGHHQAIMQSTIPSIPPSPLPQVQVIQQPLSASYVQQLYPPQQQMLFPSNLTLQTAGMTGPTLQGLGTAQGLSLQLQAKTNIDPKASMSGQTLMQAVNAASKGLSLNANNMMSASGQLIGTSNKACMPNQMICGPPKSSAIIQNQAGFVPSTTNQTVVIGQLGMLPNQQSIFSSHRTISDSQKGKAVVRMMNQPAALQPKSPIFPLPTTSAPTSGQVISGNHFKQMTSSPQIITSQAPATMISQAQLLGSLHALGASLPQGITWATPACLQSPTLLAQNPIIIRSQQSDMFIQSPPSAAVHLPVATASAPLPPTSVASSVQFTQKSKQVRVRPASSVATQTIVSNSATMHSHTPSFRTHAKSRARTVGSHLSSVASGGNAVNSLPQMATTQTQTHASHPQPLQQANQKADASNQTKPVPEMKSIATQSKLIGTESKQQQFSSKSQTEISPQSGSVEKLVTPTVCPVTASTTANVTTVTTTDPINVISTPTSGTICEEKIEAKNEETAFSPSFCTVDEKVAAEKESKNTVEKLEYIIKPVQQAIKEKQPQKAIVKPHVLTHVIDGYIIQEGPEPFPVSRSSLLTETPPEKVSSVEMIEELPVVESTKVVSPEKKRKIHKPRGPVELAKCEFCGKLGAKSKFKRSKRFCSTSCAKRYNVCCSKRLGLLSPATQQNIATDKGNKKKKIGFKTRKGWRKTQGGRLAYNVSEWQIHEESHEESSQMDEGIQSDESAKLEGEKEETTDTPSAPESPISPIILPNHKEEMEVDVPEQSFQTKSPLKWTVQDVCEFIHSHPGCADYADEFRAQEIDGQALLLLKEDHLMSAMSMKLGPALKICARINAMKEGSAHS